MTPRFQNLFATGCLLFCVSAIGEDLDWRKPLSGSYRISGASVVDPPEGEARDTHLRIHLTGEAAKSLYSAMKVKPRRDQCRNDGTLIKFVKDMQCTLSANRKQYECWFAVDVPNQKITVAIVC